MTTNAKMTHYSKSIVNHEEVWAKNTFEGVMWQDKVSVAPDTGYRDISEVNVYIPVLANYIKNEDIIVKGIQSAKNPSELNTRYYTITSVINCDYGSLNMQHTELVGR